MLNIRPSLLVLLLSIVFFSCQKEYSLEGNVIGGSAVFTLDGAPGACTNALVTGSYQVGVALGAANQVTISVDVTTVGTYTVSTTTVNGITFSGAGTFPSTGPQTVVLTGSGIPLAPGNFTFSPGTNSCAFAITVSGGGGSSGGTALYTLNGAPGNCTGFTAGGTFTAGSVLTSANFAVVSVNVTSLGTYIITSNTINGIVFTGNGTFTATGTQLVQLTASGTPLAPGIYPFTPGTNGCAFMINVSPANTGTAVFTYGGAPGNCSNATVAGTYTTGTALTATNTVTIDITVTTAGTYTVSTGTVNGIIFAGSGSFAATGLQTITLSGSGTPASPGVFNYAATNNGCSFPITAVAGTVATDFIKCTIDGVARTFNEDVVAAAAGANALVIGGYETVATTSPEFQINLTKTPAVTTGLYNRFSATNTTTFCIVGYYDGVAATAWVTGLLQTGTFSVNVTTLTATRVSGTFAGTLYDNDGQGTATKLVTSGQFSVPF